MTWVAIANVVRALASTALGATVAVYDNAPHTDPGDVTWVRMSFLPTESTQVQCGATNTFRTLGAAQFAVHVPLDQGDAAALVLADTIKLAFRRLTVSGVYFTTPHVQSRGREGDSWVVELNCPFYSDTQAAS